MRVGIASVAAGMAWGLATTAGAQEPGDVLGTVESQQARFTVQVVTVGLVEPFAMAFLPDGRLLVTDRGAPQGVFLVDTSSGDREPVLDLPEFLWVQHDGTGMQDLILHPDYRENGWVYIDYALDTGEGVTLAVSRGRLRANRFADAETLLVLQPAVSDNTDHLGSRLAIRDGYLFVTMGERYSMREHAQQLGDHLGTVLRLRDDGRVPADNPFAETSGARPEIWSYGHRNPQGLAFHPGTGALWLDEHGPQGGDEVNIVRRGANYGWPAITYGMEYDSEGGGPIGEGITEHEGMEQPVYYYRPSIGPSDLVFYAGDAYPGWHGDAFIGAMALQHLNRLDIVDGRVIHEERLLEDRGWRVRAIEEGPDGALYLGIDEQRSRDRSTVQRPGMIVRLSPA